MAATATRACISFGLLLLAHSCYSAYEHSSLLLRASAATSASLVPSTQISSSALPPDVSLETILSVALICVGLVAGMEGLQPIRWRAWAGKIEREGTGGPWAGLEERMGFVDIRAKRKDFADWVRDRGTEHEM